MTAPQHRILRHQYPQSQSQPIPQRFGNAQQQQYGSQAFSPRLPGQPSSSPLHQQFYPPAPHDMYKSPGVAGTPPMMGMHPQYFMNGGQRPRAPNPNMQVRNQMFYPPAAPPMVRYPNVAPPGPSHYYTSSPAVSQYPMMPTTHNQMQQQQAPMYTQPGYAQYPPPAPHQSPMPPVTLQSQMMVQPPQIQSASKRERKPIKIVDPSTNRDITEDIMKSKSDSLSTPPSGRSSVTGTPPTAGGGGGDVAARFAAQVAAAAGTGKGPAGAPDPSVMPVVNSPFVPQEPIVGSPNISGPMMSYTPPPPFMTGPPQRHRMVHPSQLPHEPINHQASRINHPHNQMQPMGAPLQPQQQAYQFSSQPQQQISGTTQDVPLNIPENVHTLPAPSQPVLKPGQVRIARPPVTQEVDPPKVTKTVSEPSNPPAEVVKSQSDSEKPDITIPDVAPVESHNGATVVETQNDETVKPVVTSNAEPAENNEVPSVPEDLKQAPEKEDTAIRLENTPTEPPVDQTDKENVELPEEQSQSTQAVDTEFVHEAESQKSDEAAQKVVDSCDNDKSSPMPSRKPLIDDAQPELKGDMPLPENLPNKEPVQAEPVVADHVEPTDVDSSSQPETVKPSQQKVEKPPAEHVAVNGVSSDASLDKETTQETKQDDAPSIKAAESEVDSKGRDPSHSNEKVVTEKNTEKSNGDSAKSKSVNEIKYPDEDQWSPANQQGRRQYDSNFLLQFQNLPTSLLKPKDLPNIDCVLEQPHKKSSGPMEVRGGGSDFIPHFALPRSTPRGDKRYGRQSSREHRPPPRHGRQPIIIPKKVVSIDKDVELKTSANAWKPIKHSNVSAEEKETMAIERDVRVILNKVTPSTFKELMQQVLALKIDTEKKLRKTIDLIFEKAIDEPSFSEAYANMCRQMTQIRVTQEPTPDQTNPPGQVEFRKLLLTKCQREFEREKSDREILQELKKKMDENTNQEIAAQLKEEYDTAEFKDRRRTLGNIRFIGELFKLRMLTEPIMHSCIMTLFKAKDDDHLESLCRLLTTIGKDLDHPKAKQRLNQYFDQIKKTIAEKRTSARVRFMLQDVYDLRSNNWVPRAIQTQGPKTISQIHQDAKNEQEMLQLKLATTPIPPVKHNSRGAQNRMGNRVGHEDGWTKVQTPKPTRFDPSKMKLLKANTDETKVTLGPSRGFGGWKSGSAGSSITKSGSSGYSPSTSMDRTPEGGPRSNTPTSMVNRFSALQGGPGSDHDYQRRSGGRQGSREGSRSGSRGSMGPPSSNSGARTPRRDERTSLLEATRKITSADRSQDSRQRRSTSADRSQDSRQRRSRESSPAISKPRPATPQQTEPTHKYNTALDEEKMQQKSRSILEEFLDIVDFKEATECIEELNAPPNLMHCFVYVAHEFTLEKKKSQRDNIGRLMAHLLKRGRLSVEQYIKGLAELLELATDYEIDIPMVWEYFAEQMVPVFDADNEAEISINVLETLSAPLQEEGKSGVFVAKIVKEVIQHTSLESFVARWQRSNLSWSKIIGKDDQAVRNFLEDHKLEALADCKEISQQNENTVSPVWPNKSNDRYRLEKDTTELLNEGLSNDQIFDWVEKTLSPEAAIGPDFIRALTISVCKRSLSRDPSDADKMILDEEKISERSILLKKYIDTRPERELQVLYALQNLMMELDQPRDILRKFFDIFYNEDVVQEQTFFKWEKSDDPNEKEGFGVAVASVNMFFTWLRTAEPESD